MMGVKIADVDECSEGTHNCSNVSKCVDTEGSYHCTNEDEMLTTATTSESTLIHGNHVHASCAA